MKKKIISLLMLSVLICTNIFGLSKYTTFESEAVLEAFGWYTMPNTNGERPSLPSEFSYISDNGGVFLGEDEKVLYLTFDAGYANENVEKILDVLKEKDVKGSFFLNGGIFKFEADVVKRISDEGHLVCNHTENHKNLSKINDFEQYKYEVEKLAERYKELCGKEIGKYLRPPEGEINKTAMEYNKKLGYKTVFWSIAYADWDNKNQMSYEKAINTVLGRTHNGGIVLLHPTSKTNAAIIGTLIDRWREMGYSFKTLDELPESL